MSTRLTLNHVCAGYGESTIVQNVSLDLNAGESLAILGRNGMGKSTLLATLAGIATLHSGHIMLNGADISRTPSYLRARMGLGWVPQERAVFTTLTVDENLSVAAHKGYWNAKRVYDRFPRLARRRRHLGTQLSGGEQQMLAIGRALMLNPCVLLLDEPLEGMAPIVARELLESLSELIREHAMIVIIVEQHPQHVLPITQRAIILERGQIVYHADSGQLLHDTPMLERRLGLDKSTNRTEKIDK